MEKRMGIFFAIILGGLYILHMVAGFLHNLSLSVVIDPFHVFCLIGCIISIVTIYSHKTIAQIIQIIIISISALIALYDGSRGMFSGLSLFFIAVLLAYSYGIYNTRPQLRITVSIIFLYVAFAFCPYCDDGNKYINAAAWVGFIVAMCFAVWFIFKDQLDRHQELERQNKERYMRIIEEATSVARDAIALCEKEKKKIESER